MDILADPATWASLATLIALEIVLGVDNVIFISIVADRLPRERRDLAMRVGLVAALGLRIAMLLSISWIMSLQATIVTLFGAGLSWRDLILLAGGLFLLYKSATEIHDEIEGPHVRSGAGGEAARMGLAMAIGQIMVLDAVFAVDSVITAFGLAEHVEIMIAANVVAIAVMITAASPVAGFVSRHPSTKMLALAFLVMIGMALCADGLGYHIERGFIYAAMAFSGAVEALNLLRRRRRGDI